MHFIPELMKRCKDEGIKITREGLYHTGQLNGFLIKDDNGKFQLDKKRFESWITDRKSEVPKGYKRIVEISLDINLSKATCYSILKKHSLSYIKKKGIIYAEEEKFREVVGKRGINN